MVIGAPIFICGARFLFEYSFHSIPTICFEVSYKGKKFFFSGDTFYDPKRLEELHQEGLFSKPRFESLALRDFTAYDLILHEAGIPPIHTSLQVLGALPPEVKEKLFLIHIASHDISKEHGLKGVCTGFDFTHTLIARDDDPDQTVNNLDLICSMDIVQWMPFNRISELMQCIQEQHFRAGETIVRAGTRGDCLYIVKNGSLRIVGETPNQGFIKTYLRGDYFGESALLRHGERLANIIAITDCDLLVINKYDFHWIFDYQFQEKQIQNNPFENVVNLAKLRRAKNAEFINNNRAISQMTESQKGLLNMYIRPAEVAPKQRLWAQGQVPSACYIIRSGKYVMTTAGNDSGLNFDLTPGMLVGDFNALMNGEPATSELAALTKGSLFVIHRDDINHFLKSFPGFFVICKDNYFVQ